MKRKIRREFLMAAEHVLDFYSDCVERGIPFPRAEVRSDLIEIYDVDIDQKPEQKLVAQAMADILTDNDGWTVADLRDLKAIFPDLKLTIEI